MSRYDFTGLSGSSRHDVRRHKMSASLFAERKSSNARPGKDESREHFLARLTHLQLQEKGIEEIEELEHCPKLVVLYLQDNLITNVRPLLTVSTLTTLHLENNDIESMEGLNGLVALRKLVLARNKLQRVSGISALNRLEDLDVSNQRIGEGGELDFEVESLMGIANSLSRLNIAGNGIRSLASFCSLSQLENVDARRNCIANIGDAVEIFANEDSQIRNLDLRGNPVCNQPRYRDNLILHGRPLRTLDDKDIEPQQRDFLMRFEMHKRRPKRTVASKSVERLPKAAPAPLRQQNTGRKSDAARRIYGRKKF